MRSISIRQALDAATKALREFCEVAHQDLSGGNVPSLRAWEQLGELRAEAARLRARLEDLRGREYLERGI